jgi:competence protein ComEA
MITSRLSRYCLLVAAALVLSVSLFSASSFASQSALVTKAVATEGSSKIDINTANLVQLAALPGIGEEIASRIIAYRSEHGLFENTHELEQVKGIGQKKLAKIDALITVGQKKP